MGTKLDTIQGKINYKIEGDTQLLLQDATIVISNHNCLKDIFYLPLAFPKEYVSLISSRLIYKKEKARQEMIDKYLYSMPIEAHGGERYANMCLWYASEFLKQKINVNIFPEGAYLDNTDKVYRGRTGAARILFDARQNNINAQIVPVAIKILQQEKNLDSYELKDTDEVLIKILSPIAYDDYYYGYQNSSTFQEKNKNLHCVIDDGMKKIAQALNREYDNQYIGLYPKGNVIFANGEKIDREQAQKSEYLNRYNSELDKRSKSLIKVLKCGK